MATRDTTSKDSAGWAGNAEGLREWSASGEGFFDLDAAYGFTDLEALYTARTPITVRISTETSGEEYSEGQAYLASLELTSGVEESATFSFEVTGDGQLNYVQLT
jgi:predicted secreted protein